MDDPWSLPREAQVLAGLALVSLASERSRGINALELLSRRGELGSALAREAQAVLHGLELQVGRGGRMAGDGSAGGWWLVLLALMVAT